MSAELPEPLLAKARDAFRNLPNRAQFQLASEITAARGREFVRLIDNVVTLSPGLRRRRNAEGEDDIHYEPCVIFFVRKKWTQSGLGRRQRIPAELLALADIDGKRQLCAVPTDVQLQDRLLDVTAQAQNGIYAQSPDGTAGYGAIACVVKDDNDSQYAVSAIHVLSPSLAIRDGGVQKDGNDFLTTSTSRPPPGAAYLQASPYGGRLIPAPGLSFDVQLAEVVNNETLRAALSGLVISQEKPYVESESELHELLADGRRMLILVPENHPAHLGSPRPFPEATLSGGESKRMVSYEFNTIGQSMAAQMAIELQIQIGAATEEGDSGCPVVIPVEQANFALVGMHVGGNSFRRTSTVIPAWRFLDPFAFEDVQGTLPPGALRLCTEL